MGHPRSGRDSRATLLVMFALLAGCQSEESAKDAARGLRFHEAAEVTLLPGLSHMGVAVGPQAATHVGEWLRRLPR